MAIRGLVEAMEIPIFNRISEINYEVRDLNQIQLDKEDVMRLRELEKITVLKRGKEQVNESDVSAVESIVPLCRLASIDKAKNQIKVEVRPEFILACSSQ
jgi:hypothetical protein